MKYIHCNGRFNNDDNDNDSKEKEKLRDLGIEIEDDKSEIVYEWIPLSLRVEEIIAFNAFDEYSCVVRLANTQSFVVDLLYGEVLYLLMPWHKRTFYRIIETIREKFRKVEVLNR